MKVSIYGAGYVGLVTAACLAEIGHDVLCADVDADKIASLRNGISPIFEPGLEDLLVRHAANGRLQFTADLQETVAFGAVQFIAVGTPSLPNGAANLNAVFAVAKHIGEHINKSCIVVDKSTVPVGTAKKVNDIITQALKARAVNNEVCVVSNPEFLKEGAAINDFMVPDRIVIGCDDQKSAGILHELYSPLIDKTPNKWIVMDVLSAELTKYAANAMLATRISFMNEISHVAQAIGADIEQVRAGIGSDKRIGPYFLNAGCGYGGSCFPKDVRALLSTARDAGVDMPLLQAVEQVNEHQKTVLFTKLNKLFEGDLKGKVIALWGLAFKPNTDDIREATSRVLCEALWAKGARVQAYDPVATDEFRHTYGERDDIHYCVSKEQALEGADVLVIATEWDEFRAPDWSLVKQILEQPVVVDGRNLFNPATLRAAGLHYYAIGRGEAI